MDYCRVGGVHFGWKGEMMSQTLQIQRYLASGKTLTPIEALQKFGSLRLAARILEIKAAGHKVKTEMVKVGNVRFARYSL